MTRSETCVLKNGVRLVMCEDKTKNRTHMEVIVKFGGFTKMFEANGKVYEIKPGIAHLLEHSLVENTIYGNMFDYLKDKYVSFNAATSPIQTSFYMNTVYDAEEHLKELIRIVNIAAFKEDQIEKIKLPILEEIKRGKDRNYEEFKLKSVNALLTHNFMTNNLGNEEDVMNCSTEFLKLVHDVYYQPENQTIAISGKFDIDNIKKLIEDIYDEIEFQKYDFKSLDELEDDNIREPFVKVVKPDLDEIVRISYKINISHLTPKEKVRLTFYNSFFLDYNFDDSSEAFKKVKNNNLSPYSIERNVNNTFENYMIINLSLFGNALEEFKSIVFDIIKNKPFDDEMFELMKKQTIIDLINRNEHCARMLSPFVSNVIDYGYYDIDKTSDIEEFSREDYFKLLNSLDFSHYSICVQTKE